MTRQITLLLLFLLLAVACYSQIRDTSWSTKIGLRPDGFIKSKNRIALFESDTFVVYSTFDFVVASIKKHFDEYEVQEDSLLLDKFFSISKSFDKNLKDIQGDEKLKARLDFRIVDLIQRRQCLVYNKVSKKFELIIFVTSYIKKWWAGIRFSTGSNLQIMDIVTGAF